MPNLFRKLDPKEPISKSAKRLSLAATPFGRKWQVASGGCPADTMLRLRQGGPLRGNDPAMTISSLGTWGYSEEPEIFLQRCWSHLVTLMSPPGRVRNSCYKVAASTQAASNLGEQSSRASAYHIFAIYASKR